MAKARHPVTPAVRALRAAGVSFVAHEYDYVEKGGTAQSSAQLGVPEHIVIKTIVLETEHKDPLIVLMHGDRRVSTKSMARHLGVKLVRPCEPAVVTKHTGYLVGGTSPFGTRRALPVYVPPSVIALPRLFINGGKRGFLVEVDGVALVEVLRPAVVEGLANDDGI